MKHNLFVINMKESVDRRLQATEILDRLGLSYEVFEAVNGVELSEEEMSLCSDDVFADFRCKIGGVRLHNALSAAEKCCALSHLRIYQKILDLGLDYWIIMEDDIDFNKNTIMAIDNIWCIKEAWDIVHLATHCGIKSSLFNKKYYFDKKNNFYFKRVGFNNSILNSIFNKRRLVGETCLYVISSDACKKLINSGYPVRQPADYLTGMIAVNNLKLFKAYPICKFIQYRSVVSDIGARSAHPLQRIK